MTRSSLLGGIWIRGLSFQSSEAKSNISTAKGMYPLLAVVKAADRLASFILEA